MSSYSPSPDRPPTRGTSRMQSTSGGLNCCAVASSYTSNENKYNKGTINLDPIYTHNKSLVKGYVSYKLLNNAPKVVESRLWILKIQM